MRNEDKKTCTCDVCGKIFPYRHGYGVATCSKFCLSELRKSILSKDTMVKKVCKNCGKEYIQEHWRKSDFCCKDCYWEYRRSHSEDEYADVQKERSENAHEIRKCEWCGKDFYVYKKSKKRFCSNDCRKAYSRTDAQKEKRKRTMLERYGSLSLGGLGSGTENEEAKRLRLEKQADLCEKSNMTLLGHESRFVLKVKCNKCGAEFNYEETVYFKNGFKYVSKTVPNYWYFHKNNPLKRLHRFNFTKMSILKKNPQMNKDKTEWTLMQELGYNRIWDCGNLKFELLL